MVTANYCIQPKCQAAFDPVDFYVDLTGVLELKICYNEWRLEQSCQVRRWLRQLRPVGLNSKKREHCKCSAPSF